MLDLPVTHARVRRSLDDQTPARGDQSFNILAWDVGNLRENIWTYEIIKTFGAVWF